MGKRERRRKRQRAKMPSPLAPQPIIREFPEGNPRIRIVIAHDASEDAQRLSILYWEVKDDGTWARTVSSIGAQGDVAETATSNSHALLLNSHCVSCAEPIRVANRSWAVKVAGRYLDRENDRFLCPECSAVQRADDEDRKQREAEKKRAEKERQRRKAEEDAAKIDAMLARENDKELPEEYTGWIAEDVAAFVVYAGMVSYSQAAAGRPIPALAAVGAAGWTGDFNRDYEAICRLYAEGLIALHPNSKPESYVVNEDGTTAFKPSYVQWRLVGGADAETRLRRLRDALTIGGGEQAGAARRAFGELADSIEVANIAGYLDGLLTKKYDYPEVQPARREDLDAAIRLGFRSGYTAGQMVCFAWRAADTAAGWKERNAGMGAPEASSASVTTLRNKIVSAIENRHAVPEYEPPRWHVQPLGLPAARRTAEFIRRTFDKEVIATCTGCDDVGWADTERGLVRCTHPAIPLQAVGVDEYEPAED
ncbi:hypothetical protein DEJ50_00375 [Streptomyces venezuelae]|uniref:Uncharacterized protein n=1 Tax=Streptomyces venezuelae TaxID=54571 RepID=A0A5P2CZI7_STRVZ|nr:hypothetical protein [Streptomyces venezuelae]QES46541.1 hypothetical protein DEJ50_00375 [Streptomyces venezuelae]